jgi:anti-sigma regulatory factor (Ser/Thr protein kinase)
MDQLASGIRRNIVPSPPILELEVPAVPAVVPQIRGELRRFVSEHCDGDDDLSNDVALAVTEATGNVIRHAYPTTPGQLTVSATIQDATLIVLVADLGVGLFEPARDPGLGFGIPLMRTTTEDLVIDSRPGAGTDVQLHFPCHSSGQPSP